MFKCLQKILFKKKSPVRGFMFSCASSFLLMLIKVPVSVRHEISAFFRFSDTYRGLHSFLWLINRSYLKFNETGKSFPIGLALSDNARRDLLYSRFTEGDDESYSRMNLIFSALQENPDSKFWIEQYQKECAVRDAKKQGSFNDRPKPNKHSLNSQSDALSALSDLKKLFDDMGTTCFLVSGTFLGLIREGRFLGHDYDIDIGCYYQDFNIEKLVQAVFQSSNLYMKEISHYLGFDEKGGNFFVSGKPLVVKLVHSSYISIDVFIHWQRDKQIFHGSSIHVWSNSLFQLKEYDFLGLPFLGPEDYDSYLRENYGNWEEEKKDFDCDRDTPNLGFPDTPQARVYCQHHSVDINFLRQI